MANRIEKLTKRASEIVETKMELKAEEKISGSDLSIVKELLSVPLQDDSSILEIRSLSKAVETEKQQLEKNISLNNEKITETLNETDDFMKNLEANVRTLERMGKTSDLVDVGRQVKETESRIDELEEVKRILGMDSPHHLRGAEISAAGEYSVDFEEKAELRHGGNSSGSVSKSNLFKRIGFGIAATVVAATAPLTFVPPKQKNEGNIDNAHHETYRHEFLTPDQIVEQYQQGSYRISNPDAVFAAQSQEESKSSDKRQAVHDLAKNIEDAAEAIAEIEKRRKERQQRVEASNNKPEYTDEPPEVKNI